MAYGFIKNTKTGVEILGEMINYGRHLPTRSSSFPFRIEGTTLPNTFYWQNWEYTPTVPPLPTLIGSVIWVGIEGGDHVRWMLCQSPVTTNRYWRSSLGKTLTIEALMAHINGKGYTWGSIA